MIYEMRTYTTPAGKAPVLADLSAEIARDIRGDEYGKLEGYWVTEVGPLNKCMHLWSYDDLHHRDARRAALSGNERWKNEYLSQALPLILRQDIRLMTAARPLNPPTTKGNTTSSATTAARSAKPLSSPTYCSKRCQAASASQRTSVSGTQSPASPTKSVTCGPMTVSTGALKSVPPPWLTRTGRGSWDRSTRS